MQMTKGIEDWIEGLLSGSEGSDVARAEGGAGSEDGESEDARTSGTATDQGDGGDANEG